MIQFISEFKLPKEFSKKKKFGLLIGMIVPNDSWKNSETELKWNINLDHQKVFLTIDECIKYTIESALNSGVDAKVIREGYAAISEFTYSATDLNEISLHRNPHNEALDCEWNPDDTSFMFTFRDTTWEDIVVSSLKVDSLETAVNDDGFIKVVSFTVHPVVDMTRM